MKNVLIIFALFLLFAAPAVAQNQVIQYNQNGDGFILSAPVAYRNPFDQNGSNVYRGQSYYQFTACTTEGGKTTVFLTYTMLGEIQIVLGQAWMSGQNVKFSYAKVNVPPIDNRYGDNWQIGDMLNGYWMTNETYPCKR